MLLLEGVSHLCPFPFLHSVILNKIYIFSKGHPPELHKDFQLPAAQLHITLHAKKNIYCLFLLLCNASHTKANVGQGLIAKCSYNPQWSSTSFPSEFMSKQSLYWINFQVYLLYLGSIDLDSVSQENDSLLLAKSFPSLHN